MNCPFIRYAIITGARSTHEIERALPDNYRIIHGPAQWEPYEGATYKRPVWVIAAGTATAGRSTHTSSRGSAASPSAARRSTCRTRS